MLIPLGLLYNFLGDGSMVKIPEIMPLYIDIVTKLAYVKEQSPNLLYKIDEKRFVCVDISLDTQDLCIYKNTLQNISTVLLQNTPQVREGHLTAIEDIRVGDMLLGIVEAFHMRTVLSDRELQVIRNLLRQTIPDIQRLAPNAHYHQLFSVVERKTFDAMASVMLRYMDMQDFTLPLYAEPANTLEEIYAFSTDKENMKAAILDFRNRIMYEYADKRYDIPAPKRKKSFVLEAIPSIRQVSPQDAKAFYQKIKHLKG